MNEDEVKVIKMETPLPCGTWTPDGECGQDAYVAYAYRLARGDPRPYTSYAWGLLPVCKQCAEELQESYTWRKGDE